MSRWVVLQQTGLKGAKAGRDQPDGPLGRIAKYVPAEIVSPYTMLFSAMVPLARAELEPAYQPLVPAGLIVLFLVATILYVHHETKGPVRKAHLIVSPLAFLAWAYPISSALLGRWFDGLAALSAQALVIALSLMLKRAPD